MIDTSSYQKQSKTLEEELMKRTRAYISYLYSLESALEKAEEKVKEDEELKKAIKYHKLYVSDARSALEVVSEHIPEALPSLVKLIENLNEWSGYGSLLPIDQEALKEYADKYYFMAHFMSSIPTWWVSKWEHTPKEIEGFIEGMKSLAGKGKEIIDGLYKLYKEVYRLALEDISKIYKTIDQYRLEEARAGAAGTIEYLLVDYFSNPKEYEDQLMKYAGMKPLDWLDRAICNLYGGCKTEKQNT
jgi:chromosome segregation ATPase